jgi:hypothetical protein
MLIRARQVTHALPVLEGVLSGLGRVKDRQLSSAEGDLFPTANDDAERLEQPVRLLASRASSRELRHCDRG